MASYEEVKSLFNEPLLLHKVEVAIIVAASDLLDASPTATEIIWCASALKSPKMEAQKALMFVLAKNRNLSFEQIKLAADSAIQNNVDSVIPYLVASIDGI